MDLSSVRLTYTLLTPADFARYEQLVMNEAVMKYITGKALNHEEAKQRFQVAMYATRAFAGAGFFIAKSRHDGIFVGIVKLVGFEKDKAEVGYMLLPEYWGKGYASEMLETMILLARQQQHANELIGIVDPENPASIRVLTKFGFRQYETGQIDGLPATYFSLNLSDSPG